MPEIITFMPLWIWAVTKAGINRMCFVIASPQRQNAHQVSVQLQYHIFFAPPLLVNTKSIISKQHGANKASKIHQKRRVLTDSNGIGEGDHASRGTP